MTAVLHTWGQNLSRHVHVHCLIPGGVLTGTGDWHKAKSHYLFPVRALSRRFRGRMVSMLRASVNAGELHRVTHCGEVDGVLNGLMQQEWVVYTRPCLSQADTVVDYLARYTHRIAISNGRLLSMDGDRISFRYKDYRDGSQIKTQWLDGQEFVRRFLMHILPKGFMRIRHFGYLCNRTRRRKPAVIPAGERWKKGYLRGNLRGITTRNRLVKDRMRPKPADIASYLAPDVPFRSGLQITLSLSIVR